MKAVIQPLLLHFKRPAGTSRGIMKDKTSWLIKLEDRSLEGKGEISIIEDLSKEFTEKGAFEKRIREFCDDIMRYSSSGKSYSEILHIISNDEDLIQFPSILFGLESAFLDLINGGKQIYFPNAFARGKKKIPINGLVWMGDKAFMKEQIDQKLRDGFTTIKMKIGAIDLETEFDLLRSIRENYSAEEITLRVDANGAFSPEKAKVVLDYLSELGIHSIEQPIAAGQWSQMASLCAGTPTPVALDEELIGIYGTLKKSALLDTIKPQYIILKPSLHGGISGTREWIQLAEDRNIKWWMTSALESNIGLEVICQLAAEYQNDLPQGLGTGSLYTNNVPSDLKVESGFIFKEKGA